MKPVIRGLCAVLVLALLSPVYANENETFDRMVEEARKLPNPPPRYIENLKVGVRGVTFRQFALSTQSEDVLYVTSWQGYVYGTSDGGLSWTEARLTTERSKFYGAIRPRPAPNGAPFRIDSAVGGIHKRGFMNFRLSDMNQFGSGTTGISYLDEDRSGPQPFASLRMPSGMRLAGDYGLYDRSVSGGDGGDAMRYGIGLTRAALRMQALLKKKHFRLIGMNLKLMLNLRGMEPTSVNFTSIHPEDSKTILVGTDMGLYRSRDGGIGFDHIFPGRSLKERVCNIVRYHPTNHNIIYLGTNQGFMVSTDGGEKFARPTGTQLSTAPTKWIEIAPSDPNVIYAGTTIGAFRSLDGGKTWRWIFYETLNAQNFVISVSIDPHNVDIATLATKDGMFRTTNGGKTWTRSGGFLFTGVPVIDVRFDPRDGNHQIAHTYRKVWETFDGGKSWNILYINDSEWSPRDISFDPRDPDIIWVLTSAEVLRLTSKPPAAPSAEGLKRLRKRLRVEPTLATTLDSVFKTTNVHRGNLGKLRSRARYAALLPQVNAFAGYMKFDADMALDATYTDYAIGVNSPKGSGVSPSRKFSNAPWTDGLANKTRFELLRQNDIGYPYWGVFLNWDLTNFLFHMEEAPYGRYFHDTNRLYMKFRYEVQRLYEERRRVMIRLLTARPDTVRGRLTLHMRLEELTAHLTVLTGGLFDEPLRWVQGLDWMSEGGSSISAVTSN